MLRALFSSVDEFDEDPSKREMNWVIIILVRSFDMILPKISIVGCKKGSLSLSCFGCRSILARKRGEAGGTLPRCLHPELNTATWVDQIRLLARAKMHATVY